MPKLKTTEPEFVQVKRLLLGYGLNAPRIAELIGCSAPTARRKLKTPSLFTLGELKAVALRGGVPIDELREAIKV